ncbi:MAG: dihydrolipoyl dehydrogenase [Actinomycetota bacterium]
MGDESYDLVVLGGGPGGYACAIRAAELGKRVALIEKDPRLGGTCLLRGCIPTKALLRSAEVLDDVRRSEEWGVKASGEPDWEGIRAYQSKIVDKLVTGLTGIVKSRKIEVIQGEGRLRPGPQIEVDGRTIQAADVVLATGSFPKMLPDVQISERVVTSDQALTLEFLPASAVVVGAGAVGLEFASFYRSMGAEVTILEADSRLAPLEDEEMSKELARAFRRRGIQSKTGVSVDGVADRGDHVEVAYRDGAATTAIKSELCLIAVGRGPVSDGIGYEETGVELDRGFVKVNGTLATTVPHVWAIGDVASTPLQFAHVAFAEGISVAERTAGLDPAEIDYVGVPRVTFCTPEVASVGLTEAQALERGYLLEVERFSLQGLGKANIIGEGGMTKLIAEKDGPMLGIHMIGPRVTDLISEAMLTTNWEALPVDIATLIHPHPTLGEAIGEAALALAGKPLHTA